MYTQNAFARQFLVSWVKCSWFCFKIATIFFRQILFLDSVPDIHMHEHVQEFIDQLFSILGDSSPQIKKT